MKETSRLFIAFVLVLLMGGLATPAFSGEGNHRSNVTVTVANVLSITFDDDPTMTLGFTTDFATGAISDTGKTIVYKIRANNMANSALPGALSAKLNTTLSGIEIIGFTGAYENNGTASNAVLAAITPDTAIPIGTAAVAMFDKPASSGVAGKILKGKAPIHYRARALRELSPGEGGAVVLTATIKDA